MSLSVGISSGFARSVDASAETRGGAIRHGTRQALTRVRVNLEPRRCVRYCRVRRHRPATA
jgi:hypothetical protein